MIEPRYGTLQSIFAERVFRIPPYQRFFSWTRKQLADLFSDIESLAVRTDDQHHFMATVVCHRTSETREVGTAEYRIYDVVDGQQRLTTLILLLKCIELALPQDSIDREDLARILVKRDAQLILLQTNNANAHIFNAFIRSGVLPSDDEVRTHSDRNLLNAIAQCRAFVQRWSTISDIPRLMRLVLHRLGFVIHDTEDGRLVYTLFEVLNSRGLAVDWLDKAKSVLMGKAHELCTPLAADAQIEDLQGIWTRIYEELAKEAVPGDEILRITATLFYGPGRGKPLSAEDSLELIRAECRNCTSSSEISARLLGVAQRLTSLYSYAQLSAVTEVLQARLLAVAINLAAGVSEAERDRLLDQWERVTFRIYGLYNNDARSKVGDYVRLATRIVQDDINTQTYNQIMTALRALGQEFPIEGAVAQGLRGNDCYERSPELCRYVLWNYEEHLTRQLGSNATVDGHERSAIWRQRAMDSLEHILPQQVSPTWRSKLRGRDGREAPLDFKVGRIGNLLLLPAPLNGEARNAPFEEKRRIYQRHNLRMVQEVCAEVDWNLDRIEEREERIAAWAMSRWSDV